MKGFKAKILVCLLWTVCVVSLFSSQMFWTASGQTKRTGDKLTLKTAESLINSFDASIQKRFLTEPYFGIRRIEPNYPTNPHFEYFAPINDEETKSLADFQNGGWKVFFVSFRQTRKPKNC